MGKTPRLKTPDGQRPREDERPKPGVAPGITVVQDPAELMYQAYAKKLDYKGPGGKGRLKLWHELSVHDRGAWRIAFQEMRLLLASGNQIMVQTPKPGEFLLAVAGDTAYTYRTLDRDQVTSITVVRKIVSDMDAQIAGMQMEIHHDGKPAAS